MGGHYTGCTYQGTEILHAISEFCLQPAGFSLQGVNRTHLLPWGVLYDLFPLAQPHCLVGIELKKEEILILTMIKILSEISGAKKGTS